MPQFFEFGPQLQVIVNLAVENDSGVAVFRQNRLIAGVQIDDFQARGAHRKKIGLEDALLVGAAMGERSGCFPNALGRRRPIFSREPCNSAQACTPRVRSRVELEISASFALTISGYHLLALLHAAAQLLRSSKTE